MKLLKKLYGINSPSCEEDEIRDFIVRQVRKIAPNARIEVDKMGNILVTKGNAKSYPCVVAHMDEVHSRKAGEIISIVQTPHIIYGWSDLTNSFAGIGADDKNGVWINLQALREVKVMKCAFFVAEEIGCVGSNAVDLDFFADCRFIFQSDRKNGSDLIYNASGVTLASDEFLEDLNYKAWGFTKTTGCLTDVMTLSERQVGISTVNVSSGYYNPHSSSEFTKISELVNTKEFIITNMMTLSKVYPHEATRSWGGFGFYDGQRWGHSVTNYETSYWDNIPYVPYEKKNGSTRQDDWKWDEETDDDFTVAPEDRDELDEEDVEIMKSIGVYDNSTEYLSLFDTVLDIIGDDGSWMTLQTFLKDLKTFVKDIKTTRPDLVESAVIDNVQEFGWLVPPSEQSGQNDEQELEVRFDYGTSHWFYPTPDEMARWRREKWTEFTVPSDYNGLLGWCFQQTPFKKITLPDGIRRIGEGSFYDCPNLQEVNIPDTVTEIHPKAFYGCKKLRSIYIPTSVTNISVSAFWNIPHLTILGNKGSFAEEYAKRCGYKFHGIETAVAITKGDLK